MSITNSPTIADVARRASVSIATVSRVLNGSSAVVSETAARVHAAIAELNYVPRTAARVLASRKTFTIGLLLPEISGDFFSPMLRGIELAARQAGYDLLIHTTLPRPESPSRRTLGEHNTDGLIVFTGSLGEEELVRLYQLGFPLVLMHQSPPDGFHIPQVTVENKDGARCLVEHLIQVHDRQRIVFLRGAEHHEDSAWRERGYREALELHNLPFNPGLVALGGFDRTIAAHSIRSLLQQKVRFDAVFSGDDEAAVGVLTALREAGISVPQDVAVGGFDDTPLASYLSPTLTTVHAPIEQVGSEAVRLLLKAIQAKQWEPVELTVLLPTELMIRQSCGCLPKGEEVVARSK